MPRRRREVGRSALRFVVVDVRASVTRRTKGQPPVARAEALAATRADELRLYFGSRPAPALVQA
jgi:hypothetical protein